METTSNEMSLSALQPPKKRKLFSFSSGGQKRATQERTIRAPKLEGEDEHGPWFIRGVKAGSRDEYWVSLFLTWLEREKGWTWEYQYPVHYGRRRRGGNVVDFVIRTPGRWTMLEPMGRYWHTGRHEDRQQMEGIAIEKRWILIAWFTDQYKTKEAVHQFLKGALHV